MKQQRFVIFRGKFKLIRFLNQKLTFTIKKQKKNMYIYKNCRIFHQFLLKTKLF